MLPSKRATNVLLQRWHTYWFHPTPVIHLAICRLIAVAFQLFLLLKRDYYHHFRTITAFPDFLYDPLLAVRLLTFPLGWSYRPSFEVLLMVYWTTVVCGVAALLGFRTNVSLLVFAIGNIFLQAYAYSFGDYHHPEALMMITLFVLACSPAGRVLSLDALRRQRTSPARRRGCEVPAILAERSMFAGWPLLLIQWVYALIYLSTALSKLGKSGLDWMNGYTLQYYLLADGLRDQNSFGIWLGQQHTVAWLLSWLTILFEGTFCLVLIFPRLVWIYVPFGIAFHLGIYMTMRAPFFVFIFLYTVFIPWVSLYTTLSHFLGWRQPVRNPSTL